MSIGVNSTICHYNIKVFCYNIIYVPWFSNWQGFLPDMGWWWWSGSIRVPRLLASTSRVLLSTTSTAVATVPSTGLLYMAV